MGAPISGTGSEAREMEAKYKQVISAPSLRACYAMPSTDGAYNGLPPLPGPGRELYLPMPALRHVRTDSRVWRYQDLSEHRTLQSQVAMLSAYAHATDIAYGGMRCA
eukprot:3349844-Rhodomonas_salina.1